MAARDGNILKLQTDLDTVQQQYMGLLEELNIRDEEVQRLNLKVRQLQSDIRDMQAQIEVKDDRVNMHFILFIF